MRNEGGGEEGYKLNITSKMIDEIIMMVTLSAVMLVEMLCHHIIFLLESHYNNLCNVAGIYR